MPRILVMLFKKIFVALLSIVVFSVTSMAVSLYSETLNWGIILIYLIYVSVIYFIIGIPISIIIDLLVKSRLYTLLTYTVSGAVIGIALYIFFKTEFIGLMLWSVFASLLFWAFQMLFNKVKL